MAKKKQSNSTSLWEEAAKRYKLTEEDIKKGKRLNLNPKNFAGYASTSKQKPWKKPLAEFIRELYRKKYAPSKNAIKKAKANLVKRWKALRDAQRKGDTKEALRAIEGIASRAEQAELNDQVIEAYQTWATLLLEDGQNEAAERIAGKLTALRHRLENRDSIPRQGEN